MDDSEGLHKKGVMSRWTMLADHQSVLVERAFFSWLQSGKNRRHSRARISSQYIVDFAMMWLVQLFKGHWRWVMRGTQGQRSTRPSDARFADNADFNLGGLFRPLSEDWGK